MQSTAKGVAPAETAANTADSDRIAGDLAGARAALALEADGIRALSDSLNGCFSKALDILSKVSGRVIVTGMGKSGHIGRKIAATFASTGTPSQYVHPGEASHGDLGMITEADAVLALSNSGETSELSDLLQHCRRFSIPLIAITSRAGSTLDTIRDGRIDPAQRSGSGYDGLGADHVHDDEPGAWRCAGRRPIEPQRVHRIRFQSFASGGKLGRQLLRIRDIMHSGDEVPLVPENAAIGGSRR